MKKPMYSEVVIDPHQHCGCCTKYDDGDPSVGIWGGCDNQDYHLPEDLESHPEACEKDQQLCGEDPAHCLGFTPHGWYTTPEKAPEENRDKPAPWAGK